MARLPEKTLQILQAHAGLIQRVAIACRNRDLVPDLEEILRQAEQNEWVDLVAAIRRILAGEREPGTFGHLDEEDRTIVEAILRGIQDPDSLQELAQPLDPGLAAPGLASLIHAARKGSTEALQAIGAMATQMLQAGGDMARIAGLMRPLVLGERDAGRLCQGLGESAERLVENILRELARLEADA